MNSNSHFHFKTFDIDQMTPRKVIFRNPFPNSYDSLDSREELIKTWNEECRIREEELYEWFNDISNRP